MTDLEKLLRKFGKKWIEANEMWMIKDIKKRENYLINWFIKRLNAGR